LESVLLCSMKTFKLRTQLRPSQVMCNLLSSEEHYIGLRNGWGKTASLETGVPFAYLVGSGETSSMTGREIGVSVDSTHGVVT